MLQSIVTLATEANDACEPCGSFSCLLIVRSKQHFYTECMIAFMVAVSSLMASGAHAGLDKKRQTGQAVLVPTWSSTIFLLLCHGVTPHVRNILQHAQGEALASITCACEYDREEKAVVLQFSFFFFAVVLQPHAGKTLQHAQLGL